MFSGGGYDEKVDMWALGVSIFKLMAGYTPFESEYHSDTITNIINGEVVFPNKFKFPCSQGSKNLVKRLLKNNKNERLSAEEALKDIWFMDMKSPDEVVRSLTLQRS